MENFQQWLILESGLNDVASLRDHNEPMVLLNLDRRLAARTGRSIRLVRTLLEITVVTAGWLIGGIVGIGTVVYALAIGPLVQLFLPLLTIRLDRPEEAAAE